MADNVDIERIKARLAEVHEGLLRSKLTVATAESCTGGLLSSFLSSLPGSSAYFLGGVVAYSNFVKAQVLTVDAGLIDSHGAVSQEVGSAMALAAARITGADIGIGITGIAGPGGATPDKPVGTVWLGVARGDSVECRNLNLNGSRDEIRYASVYEALQALVMRGHLTGT